MRKLHRVLVTRNEVDHLGEYLNERRNGLVECIELYVIQRCGMTTHNYLPFVRTSADAIGLERFGDDEDGKEDFDCMKSHLTPPKR